MLSVASVKTPAAALSVLRSNPAIDLVVTDLHMPGMNGIELQKRINKEFRLPVISEQILSLRYFHDFITYI